MLLELMGMAIGASVVEGSRLVKSAKMDDRALKNTPRRLRRMRRPGSWSKPRRNLRING